MSNSTHAFSQAITALFGSDALAQAQANSYLNDFSTNIESWNCAVSLIGPSSEESVAFFCANLLLNKTRKEWPQTSQQIRLPIKAEIRRVKTVSAAKKGHALTHLLAAVKSLIFT